jgi:TPR repeat protein
VSRSSVSGSGPPLFDKASNQGPQSQLLVGRQFQYGQLLDKDYSQAKLWIQKAADQGFASAQMALGQLFEYTDQDYAQAKLWYQKAADQGNTFAKTSMDRLKTK